MNTYLNIIGNAATTLVVKQDEYSSESNTGYQASANLSNNLYSPPIKSMTLCNVHATDSVIVDLYITKTDPILTINSNNRDTRYKVPKREYVDIEVGAENDYIEIFDSTPPVATTETYYILKRITLPIGATLVLEQNDLQYNNILYDLVISLNAVDSSVDVIIK